MYGIPNMKLEKWVIDREQKSQCDESGRYQNLLSMRMSATDIKASDLLQQYTMQS